MYFQVELELNMFLELHSHTSLVVHMQSVEVANSLEPASNLELFVPGRKVAVEVTDQRTSKKQVAGMSEEPVDLHIKPKLRL